MNLPDKLLVIDMETINKIELTKGCGEVIDTLRDYDIKTKIAILEELLESIPQEYIIIRQ